jgi:dTDP-4-dehydrorhamnose 3,5-epimerase
MQIPRIKGLSLFPLKQISDERGAVYHFLKSTSPSFKGFGEAYYSKINESVIKGWKLHKSISQNFCVPYGKVRIVIYDDRLGSSTKGVVNEITLDDNENYNLLNMVPGLWYSFKCESDGFALLSNIIDMPHTPDESVTLPLETLIIPYEWN